jgi:hypothetical protein
LLFHFRCRIDVTCILKFVLCICKRWKQNFSSPLHCIVLPVDCSLCKIGIHSVQRLTSVLDCLHGTILLHRPSPGMHSARDCYGNNHIAFLYCTFASYFTTGTELRESLRASNGILVQVQFPTGVPGYGSTGTDVISELAVPKCTKMHQHVLKYTHVPFSDLYQKKGTCTFSK